MMPQTGSITASLSLRLSVLSMITLLLPLSAFVFCIVASITWNSKESTSTHCKVHNFLPSVSTSIGNFAPQKYVWRIAIALHSSPRYLLAYLQFVLVHQDALAFLFSLVEISSLLGLSFVSSIDDFGLHALFFTLFQVCALLHMTRIGWIARRERLEDRVRWYCGLINLASGALAVYTYLRHNWYCEPGLYSMFALSEYGVVLSNMCFHIQVIREFQDIRVELSTGRGHRRLTKAIGVRGDGEREHLV